MLFFQRLFIKLISLAIIITLFSGESNACTTFCLHHEQQMVFGKNYDWNIDYGLVIVNKRGLQKSTMAEPGETPFTWTSRFGSVTFNQYGRDLPSGGINEAGLVIELLWLEETEYPKPDSRPSLGSTQWIQYQLDTAANVEELLASDKEVRVFSSAKIHFLASDRSGRIATIEFLDGKLVAHTGKQLTSTVLANSSYAASCDYLKQHRDFGGSKTISQSNESLDRFVRASSLVKSYDPEVESSIIKYAFNILNDVSQGSRTQWSIVYDLQNMEVHYRTRNYRQIKTIRLQALDFSCNAPAQILDMNSSQEGDVSANFKPYSRKANRNLIGKSFRGTSFLRNVPDTALDQLAKHPEEAVCQVAAE